MNDLPFLREVNLVSYVCKQQYLQRYRTFADKDYVHKMFFFALLQAFGSWL